MTDDIALDHARASLAAALAESPKGYWARQERDRFAAEMRRRIAAMTTPQSQPPSTHASPTREEQTMTTYHSQAARDAAATNYGDEHYWATLDEAAQRHHAYYMARGEAELAESMLTRSLGEALQGNDGA